MGPRLVLANILALRLVQRGLCGPVSPRLPIGLRPADAAPRCRRARLCYNGSCETPSPAPAQAQAAEAEEAQRKHRPGRRFGDRRRTRAQSEYGRASRHDKVERGCVDHFLQPHAPAAGPRIHGLILQAAPLSVSASKPPIRLPKVRMSKLSCVASVKPPIKSIARPPSSVVSLVTESAPYWHVAGKVQVEHAGGSLVEIACDRFGRRELQRSHVDHGPGAAIDGDIVAERRIAAGEGEVPGADGNSPAGPGPEGSCLSRQ